MSTIPVPPVSLEDLQHFQAKHFPSTRSPSQNLPQPQPPAQTHATHNATPAVETTPSIDALADTYSYEDEDDLGYYPDGVKRTLTDEQIRIFRHSEIHALLRERQIRQENEEYERAYGDGSGSGSGSGAQGEAGPGAENHSRESLKGKDTVGSVTADSGSLAGKKRSAEEPASSGDPRAKKHSTKPTPDTSDVQLDYNEEENLAQKPKRATKVPPPFMSRRIISYED
ncbi:hypothetical protein BDV18DRAFT_145956 [Aspergillus unguis]